MIRLARKRAAIPAAYRGAGLAALLTDLLAGYYEFKGDIPFNQQKSRFQKWAKAKPALARESLGKCAYCESPTAVVAYGDVEHFRPKDLYWWLAFSFDNYTFACPLCNQKFKGANFPVAGTRVKPAARLPKTRPAPAKLAALAAKLVPDPASDTDTALRRYFAREGAHLPHPYLDDPETLFAWRADDDNLEVRLVPAGSGAVAKRAVAAAEQFLGLNREDLVRMRYATYAQVHALCLVLQEATTEAPRRTARAALERATAPGQPYAGMTRYFLRTWGVLV